MNTTTTTQTHTSATTQHEEIPLCWDDDRDQRFFRATAVLFTPEFLYGASVLLASYDADTSGE